MSDLSGQVGELKFMVSIKRKETGETETYEMVGKCTEEQVEELIKQQETK